MNTLLRARRLSLRPRRQPRPGGGRLARRSWPRRRPAARRARRTSGTCWSRAARRGRISRSRTASPARPRRSRPRPPRATTSRSGCTPRARRAAPRAPSTSTTTWSSAAETYAKQVLGIRPTDKVYSAAKLFFAYGLGNAGYFPMSVGAQSVLYPRRPTPDVVFDLVTRHRPTIFFGVPTLYAAMLAAKESERPLDLSSLRLCVSAGEALPADLYRRWRERFGVEIIDGIGTTESGHIFLSNRPGAVRPGSSGLPGPRLRVRHRRRRGPAGGAGRDRKPAGPGRLDHGLLLEPARQDEGHPPRSVDPDRRQVPPGRGRLLLVRRPRRRHAQGRGHLGLARSRSRRR